MLAGWGLGLGRGPGEGGAAWAPAAAACPAPPRQRGFLLQSKPRLCRPELEPEPEQERSGGEGKEAVGWVFSWRRPYCRLLTTLTRLLVLLASPSVWVLSVCAFWPVYFSLILFRSLCLFFSFK